ncbi:MAG: aminotransferase class I/II-fold pyridoxal phosphate-dependent enzyme [Endomicrobium sp.]|nr:aminotransferase class I/II-fold pyridoxal phosphate-dependent enzyme [Endomicrobium sp.]
MEFLKDFYSIFKISNLNFGTDIVIPNIYPVVKSAAKFASKNKIFKGKGLIFDIAGIYQAPENIDGIETKLIARMPDFIQKAIIERQIKKEDFKNETSWLKFLYVSYLLSDFIRPSKTAQFRHAESMAQEQSKTPLWDAVKRKTAAKETSLQTPGHKGGRSLPAELKEYIGKIGDYDTSLSEDIGSLHDHSGPIGEAEKLMAQAYGVEHSFFLVNGTTVGNHAMLFSALNPGDEVIVSRNSHKSIEAGIELFDIRPVWLTPKIDGNLKLLFNSGYDDIKEAIRKNPRAKAVLVTSPTYNGITTRLREIAELCHENGMLLLVDEAHGAHLFFNGQFPQSAVAAGADMVTQSTHKTLSALSQSSVLHVGSKRINIERVKKILSMLQTTSPNYFSLANIDLARRQAFFYGEEHFNETLEAARWGRAYINENIPSMKCFTREEIQESGYDLDETKLTVNVERTGLSGHYIEKLLKERYKIQIDYADDFNLIAIMGEGSNLDDIKNFVEALRDISKKYGGQPRTQELKIPTLTTDIAVSPREAAFLSQTEEVSLGDDSIVGRICAQTLTPYPPGIPVLLPGERITKEVVDYLRQLVSEGITVSGQKGGVLETISVIAKKDVKKEKTKFSTLKSLFSAPFAELDEISAAIYAKIGGDDKLYDDFINAHGYDGKQKEKLEAGLNRIYETVLNLVQKHSGAAKIRRTVIRLHFNYNLSAIIKEFGHNIARFFKGGEALSPPVMTVFKVKAKNVGTIERNLSEIKEKFPEQAEYSLGEDGSWNFDLPDGKYEEFKTLIRALFEKEKALNPQTQSDPAKKAEAKDSNVPLGQKAEISAANAGYEDENVINSLKKAAASIVFRTSDPDVLIFLGDFIQTDSADKKAPAPEYRVGIVKGEKPSVRISSLKSSKSIIIYAEDILDYKAGKIYIDANADAETLSAFEPLVSPANINSQIAKAIDKLIAFGNSLPQYREYEEEKESIPDFIEANDKFDSAGVLAKRHYLYETGDETGKRAWEEAKEYLLKRFKEIGIESEISFSGSSDIRYLKSDSFNVYADGKKIISFVFAPSATSNPDKPARFQIAANVVDAQKNAAQRSLYEENGKFKDLLYLSDLIGLRVEDKITPDYLSSGRHSETVSKILNEIIAYSLKLEKEEIFIKELAGYGKSSDVLLRYQLPSEHILAEDIEDLSKFSVKRKSAGGVETFYFNESDKKAFSFLVSKINKKRLARAQAAKTDYSSQENKDALTKAVKRIWLDYVNGVRNPLINEFKKDGIKAVSADFYSLPQNSGKLRINSNGKFIDIDDGNITYYAQRVTNTEDVRFGPLFANSVNGSDEIENPQAAALINKLIVYGKTLNSETIEEEISKISALPKAVSPERTDYLSQNVVDALKKAAMRAFLDYNSFNPESIQEVLKEYTEKYGLEIDYSPYHYNYTGLDISERGETDPYADSRSGRYSLSFKFDFQDFGEIYLFIAEGKIWLDLRNGYANFRKSHFSAAESEISQVYSQNFALENITDSLSFVSSPRSAASQELNGVLASLINGLISYGEKLDAEKLDEEYAAIELYSLAADGKKKIEFPKHLERYLNPNMRNQISMGSNYVPTQNTEFIAAAVTDILPKQNGIEIVKERLQKFLDVFPYPAQLSSDENSLFLKIKDPAGKNGEVGLIINKDGSVVEVKGKSYGEENGSSDVIVFNTRFLYGAKNPGTDYCYIYSLQNLTSLESGGYAKKRNSVINFLKRNNWVYQNVNRQNFRVFAKAARDWVSDEAEFLDEDEAGKIYERLKYFGLSSGFLRAGSDIEALSVAHGQGTLDIAIQKANSKPNGTVQSVNREFINNNSNGREFANFEEDLDVVYMRSMKFSYLPQLRPETNYALSTGEEPNLKYYAGLLFTALVKDMLEYGKSLSHEHENAAAAQINPARNYKISQILSLIINAAENIEDLFSKDGYDLEVTYEYARDAQNYINLQKPSSVQKLKDGADIHIFIINGETPQNYADYGFENTGLTADGQIIWVSKKTGRYVLYSKSENYDKIVAFANSSLKNIVGVKAKVSGASVSIDPQLEDEQISYDAWDNLTVSKKYLEELSELSGASLPDVISKIRKEEKAENAAMSKNFVMDLSYAQNSLSLQKGAAAFNDSGSVQIAAPLRFFYGKSASEIKEAVSALSQNGTRIFAVRESAAEKENVNFGEKSLINLGFAGIIDKTSAEIYAVDFLSGEPSKVDEIRGFSDENELERQIEKTRSDSIKLVNTQDYITLLSGNDIELKIKRIINFFDGSKIKNLFYKKITPAYAASIAYETDYSEIPDLNIKDFQSISAAFKSADAAEILTNILRIDSNPVLKTAFDKIEKNTPQEVKAEALLSFLTAVAQKAKVKADAPEGLADPELEIIFVRSALSEYKSDVSFSQNFPETLQAETGLSVMTRNDLSRELKLKVQNLLLEEKSGKNQPAVYELILLYGERKIKTEISDKNYKLDVKAVTNILSAA